MQEAYAAAVWEMIRQGRAPHEAVLSLRKSLARRGRLTLMPKIARAFAGIAARESRKNTMQLTVAREADMHAALESAKKVLLREGIRETDLVESTDAALIGGWRLEGRDVLVDTSWKKTLLTIYNRATQ